MSLRTYALESPLDLSLSAVTEPAPGVLAVATQMTSGRGVLAAALVVACLACAWAAWKNRVIHPVAVLWPWGLLGPVFGAAAVVMAFGSQSKTFDAGARTARLTASLGPLRAEKTVSLPASGTILLTFRRERGSSASGKSTPSTRHYDLDVAGAPGLGFTIASDRDAARAFAARLAKLLGWTVDDRVEDDGVERSGP
ncbi:MAG: hypothetical protein M0D55_16565 [Elusimicrobiota bacterium]|nr:MAG: hypothetical protein M0D55_16565 [Elusimicrobiota bacterium]